MENSKTHLKKTNNKSIIYEKDILYSIKPDEVIFNSSICCEQQQKISVSEIVLAKSKSDVFYIFYNSEFYDTVSADRILSDVISSDDKIYIRLIFHNICISEINFEISSRNNPVICGCFSDIIRDFDNHTNGVFENMNNCFYNIKIKENSYRKNNVLKIKTIFETTSVISYNNTGVYLYNARLGMIFDNIFAYMKKNGIYTFIFSDNNKLLYAEISVAGLCQSTAPHENYLLKINRQSNMITATDNLSILTIGKNNIFIADSQAYIIKNNIPVKCTVTSSGNDTYISISESEMIKCSKHTNIVK